MGWPQVPAHAEGQKSDGSSAWPGPDGVQKPSTAVEPVLHVALLEEEPGVGGGSPGFRSWLCSPEPHLL